MLTNSFADNVNQNQTIILQNVKVCNKIDNHLGNPSSSMQYHTVTIRVTCIPLTPYYTILTFDDTEKESFGKYRGQKEKMLVTSIFFFFHNVSILSKTNIVYNCFRFKLVQDFVTAHLVSS